MLSVPERFRLLLTEIDGSDFQNINPKVDKAMKMTRDRPNIFYRVENDGGTLIGVVRSQTNSSLIYACYLRSDGSYGCKTQNLYTCGGLRGSVCKHILTLVATAGQNRVILKRFAKWIENSKNERQSKDTDLNVYIFEQYMERMNIRELIPLSQPLLRRRRYVKYHHRDNFPIPSTIKIIDSLLEGEAFIQENGDIQNVSNTILCIGTRTKIQLNDPQISNWNCCTNCNQWFSPEAQEAFKIGTDCPSSMMGLANAHTISFKE